MKTDRDKLIRVLFDQIVVKDCYQFRKLKIPPEVVVDIGANCGVFSMLARMLYPKARVISVEPCPETFRMLEENLRFFGCELYNIALSKSKCVTIKHGADSGSNSTVDVGGHASGDGLQIPGMTLADMFSRWSINPQQGLVAVKVDCEGAERTIIEDSKSNDCLMQCCWAGFELHYCDGRGVSKWANALPRSTAEEWVKQVRTQFRGNVDYEYHGYGGVHGGILTMRDSCEWKPPTASVQPRYLF